MKTVEEAMNRKPLKASEFPEVKDSLYIWLKQQRSSHGSIPDDVLKNKAQFFYQCMTEKKDFRASDCWFKNFKKLYGIQFLHTSGEKLSADQSEISDFIQHLSTKQQPIRSNT